MAHSQTNPQPAEGTARDPPPFPPVVLGLCRRTIGGIHAYNPSKGRVELVTNDVLVTKTGPGIVIGARDSIEGGELEIIRADDTVNAPEQRSDGNRAYWLRHTLREATYGRVRYAVALRRLRPQGAGSAAPERAEAEWEITEERCAVKEMSRKKICDWKGRLTEDPIKEIAAMHYLKEYYGRQKCGIQCVGGSRSTLDEMLERHTIIPLDLLSDDQCIYSIMPYCNGELFDALGERDNFTEDECRYFLRHILIGLENIHKAGICHRDLRPENLLHHQDTNSLVIIDLGKCLRIPYEAENRCLLSPQGTCGMLNYEAPEIASDSTFDGHSIDIFAVGVILFLMLTGFPPWERPHQSDERFKYMSAGYLAQMLIEWELDLSPEAMDLLQGMLWLDPKDRLSLREIRNHAWMTLSD